MLYKTLKLPMKKNLGRISKYYLIFNATALLSICSVAAGQDTLEGEQQEQDTLSVVIHQEPVIQYPGKPLLMSLVLPGSGQYYNREPMWKTASFAGVELASIATWAICNSRAANLKDEFQSFANDNWTLANWVTNRFFIPGRENEGRLWSHFPALLNLAGTHDLILVLSGSLQEQYGEFVSSDSLELHPEWAESSEVTIARDRHFYENIGKYDQFLGGWADASSEWYWEEKDVGDTTEIIIKTPKKDHYLDQRKESNDWLSFAKFSISAIMFNHVISGMDAVWSNQRKSSRKQQSNKTIDTDVSLLYNPYNTAGIGGLAITVMF